MLLNYLCKNYKALMLYQELLPSKYHLFGIVLFDRNISTCEEEEKSNYCTIWCSR